MSRGRTTIPTWEGPMLQAIADGKYQAARDEALQLYITERERRRRHAAVRDKRDRERRTLVGAHISRAEADTIAWIAKQEDMSITAFVKLALRQAAERSDTMREMTGRP